ncbi:hypothetical protein K1T71_009858 [Dendrolimus kikuchii]|uniref:Uncharacterized protein n=1 Tax=Dendrolimus kikuchii TaxID=765133 RepID=A0ACC1CT09_9NEOP|nr:hypothetical protein K1T71_009858 [Dendrolimus kikuchii]
MPIKVGINGFGRIGRICLRTFFQNSDVVVSAINDPAIDAEYICYLIKFDSTHGNFKGIITLNGDSIEIDDQTIKIFHEKLPSNIPWQAAGVEYVVEASGMFTSLEKASGHLASDSVKRVLVTAPSIDVPMIILGVNEDKLKPVHKVMSCTSSTLYCLAPIIKILEDHFGVAEGFITSIHAMTPSLKPLDGLCLRGKHWRDHRSIHENIIPATTGACKALGKIIPEIKDKMTGLAFRVPIVDVSVLDITIRLNMNTSLPEIIQNIEKASKFKMRNIIKISREEAVSSDFVGDSHSCILDVGSSLQLTPNFFKLICWYENEYSYACRVVNSIMFSENQIYKFQLPSKLTYVRPRLFKKQDVLLQTEIPNRDCSSEVNSKILCSISQDAGFKQKLPHRATVLRKPFSSYYSGTLKTPLSTREPKPKNEIFKIWNDSPETKGPSAVVTHKQNRSAFFHSCVYLAQNAQKTESIKAKERLENAKREFTKMVNITENLLKKSYSNKMQLNSQLSISKNNSHENSAEKTKLEPSNDEQNKIIPCVCYVTQNSENSNNSMMSFDNNKNRESVQSNHCYDLNNSDYSNLSMNRCNSKINRTPTDSDNLIFKQPDNNNNVRSSNCHKTDAESADRIQRPKSEENINKKAIFKEQLTKTVNKLINGLSQNIQVQCALSYNGGFSGTYANKRKHEKYVTNNKKNSVKVNQDIKFDNTVTSTKAKVINDMNSVKEVPNNSISEEQAVSKPPDKTELIANFIEKKSDNIRIIDEELKKRNIVLVDQNKIKNWREPVIFNPDFDSLATKKKYCKDTELNKKILKGLSRFAPEPVVIVSQDVSRCASPDTIATLSNGDGNRIKQDIYDKLDSASATDSNNSFEVKERKSQVLQIADLTSSLEDLARLDKICRIIEISDELSDQLFSALDKDANKFETKKWSFKDLCERIKLDEFCSRVFEKSVG